MADRNPSKARRQAQNRAAREARIARAEAANTPVEERAFFGEAVVEPDTRSSRKKRRDASIKEKAREVIEADAIDDDDFGVDDDEDTEVAEQLEVARSIATGASRKGSSPIFSARHRAQFASTTQLQAPARTHGGVALVTGVPHLAPSATPSSRTARPVATSKNQSAASRPTTGNKGPKSETSARAATSAKPRQTVVPSQPTGRQMPQWLNRFGGNDPGGKWVMYSFVALLLASVVVNFVHILPEVAVNAKGKQVRTGRMFTIWHYGVGPGLYLLLPPILLLGLFILTSRPSNRRRSWNIALMCLVFITYVSGSIVIYFLPILLLGVGCWFARKAALDEVGGDPRVLREVEKERRVTEREALRKHRASLRNSK